MGDRVICPVCRKPAWEAATDDEREADMFCSVVRCPAWCIVGKATPPHPITGARTMLRLADALPSVTEEGRDGD